MYLHGRSLVQNAQYPSLTPAIHTLTECTKQVVGWNSQYRGATAQPKLGTRSLSILPVSTCSCVVCPPVPASICLFSELGNSKSVYQASSFLACDLKPVV